MSRPVLKVTPDGMSEVIDMDALGGYRTLNENLGYFEVMHLTPHLDIWMSEEPPNDAPRNAFAELIMNKLRSYTGPVVGTVILTGSADDEGETQGLDERQLAIWKGVNSLMPN